MRLAIAFGARGKGKALAHYEPARVVINLTKMKGAGSLAHEWAHAFDDALGLRCGQKGIKTYLSESNLNSLSAKYPVAKAMQEVMQAIRFTARSNEEIEKIYENQIKQYGHEYLGQWLDNWKRDLSCGIRGVYEKATEQQLNEFDQLKIKATQDLDKEAYDSIVKMIKELTGRLPSKESRERAEACLRGAKDAKKRIDEYKQTGVFNGKNTKNSNFYTAARELDKGRKELYYSEACEMFARCFEAYIEDQLTEKGLKSQYLVHSTASNALYGQYQPYPEGAEREHINSAIKNLIEAAKTEYNPGTPANYNIYDNKDNRVSYVDSIRVEGPNTEKIRVHNEVSPRVQVPSAKVSKETQVTDLNSLREAIVALAGNNTERGKQIDCMKYMNSMAVIGKMKLGYSGIGFNDFKVNNIKGMGNSKAYADTQVNNGRIIYIDSTQKPEKQLEALTEALINRIVTDKFGASSAAQMVAEGVAYAMCKRYGLDVRTYCLSDKYKELATNTEQVKFYLNHCKNMFNQVIYMLTH